MTREAMIEAACRDALNIEEMRSVVTCYSPRGCVDCRTRLRACIYSFIEMDEARVNQALMAMG